ncbi:hypothetical protein Cgig2_006247 [Carnegiea gigantea]|uniref:Uncharacterized protein n=1 Tax=Carnegiea gigantea TaxID=171969 RepID=A0A9Q1JEL5_9CARY|nr:hypothetical protein Cgig2_006247 [Carnegiea gigantea]
MGEGKREGRSCRNLEGKKDSDANRDTEVIAIIIGGIDDKELNIGFRKAQIRKLSQVIAAKELKPLIGPTMTFGLEDMHPFQTPHNDTLVMQLKITTIITCRILMDMGNFIDIISLGYFKKLQYNEKDLVALETPIVEFSLNWMVVKIYRDQKMANECYYMSVKSL